MTLRGEHGEVFFLIGPGYALLLLFGMMQVLMSHAFAGVHFQIEDIRKVLGYEASPAFPNGRIHPEAPRELAQFSFMIGAHECVDRRRNEDGEWIEFQAIWNARYFLNGFAIQDHYFAPDFQTSNIRIYDANEGAWKVTFFSSPKYSSGTWRGNRKENSIVLERMVGVEPSKSISRLTFFDISEQGFEWKAELIADGQPIALSWTSSCKRKF